MTDLTREYQDDGLCAVVGCDEPGRPQVCSGDGKYHWHGCSHAHPDTPIKPGAWRRFCDGHALADKVRWDVARSAL